MTRRVLAYAIIFACTLALVSSGFHALRQARRPALDPAGDLPDKTAFYLAHAGSYNLIFLGDSRAYCALHPELLDPLLGTRSINLAHWAHWLPTQYPQIRDIAPRVAPGTTVVWSLGEQNFEPGPILGKYPIGFSAVPEYLALGFNPGQLAENLAEFQPALFLLARRADILERLKNSEDTPLARSGDAPGAQAAAQAGAAGELERRALARPGVLHAEVQAPQGRPVAVSLRMGGGGYLLDELEPGHFRARQQPPQPRSGPLRLVPDPPRWALFLAALDRMRTSGLRVVVNVLEEAPHMYPDRERLAAVRAFMDGPVRREVEARGFAFVRADLDRLGDADYFDYNHLNSRGAEKYAALLAPVLRPHLPKGGRP